MLRRACAVILVATLTVPTISLSGSDQARSIDHIGFEIKGLEAFCKKLEAAGVTFEVPYREVAQLGLKLAFIVDPVGTRIELTEGLARR